VRAQIPRTYDRVISPQCAGFWHLPIGREIVVWTFAIENLEDIGNSFLQILSLDERERLSRYRVVDARLAFLFPRRTPSHLE
jgi:hypothetical protein